MRKYAIAALTLSAVIIGAAVAWAQQFGMPPPAGVVVMGCVYNAVPPTLATGQPGMVQCSSTGQLSGGGGGGGAATIADGADVAEGATANTACGTDAGTGCTVLQRLARIATNLTTLNTTAGSPINNLAASNADPCIGSLKSNFAISTTSGTTQLVAGVASKKIYVCSMLVVAGGTAAVSLIEGTNASCASSAAVLGSTTAANGVPLVVNAGWQMGSGVGTVAQTATAANYLCLFQSSTAQLSGNLTYVQQ